MIVVSQVLAQAVKHHQAGQIQAAEPLYRQVLQADPQNVVALNLLGVIAHQVGRSDMACDYIGQALRYKPDYAEAHNNLAVVFKGEGRLAEAVDSWKQALRCDPNYASAHNNLGIALMELEKLDEAVGSLQQAVRLKPDYFEAWINLGNACGRLGKPDDAAASFQQALRYNPASAEAHCNLGRALRLKGNLPEAEACLRRALSIAPEDAESHNTLAVTLLQQGKLDEAACSAQQALRFKPDFAEAHSNLGAALTGLRKQEEALVSLQQALRLKPDFADAHGNAGLALRELGRLEEAVASLQEALRLKPDYAEAYANLGAAFMAQRKLEEAAASLQQAVRLNPDDAESHASLSMVRLLGGRLEQAWPEYEWRLKCKSCSLPQFRQPCWDGSPLGGRTILIHTEQGLGDTLQFIRYAPLVKERGGRVIVACPESLIRILSGCAGIDQLVPWGILPPFDVYAPLLSLPGILGTSLTTVPANVPYLFADPGLTDRWRQELSGLAGFKIGIAWQGDRQYRADRFRSLPLVNFERLSRLEGVQLISLQKGAGTEQLAAVSGRMPVTDLGNRLDETTGAFMDTAAVMENLDLVITSDTSIAHLAGGLGVPVWVALSFAPEWRWMLNGEDSPWYPTMRLFRQAELGNWEDVFQRITNEVQKLTGRGTRSRPIKVEVAPGELIDKITILEIKSARLADPAKLGNVRVELAVLQAARDEALESTERLQNLTAALRTVNETLWQIEDDIRFCERDRDFGPRFIELARSVYHQNDQRAALKRQINDLLGSKIIEEKAYANYQ